MLEFIDTHSHIQSAGAPPDVGERSTREIWAKDAELKGDSIVSAAELANVNGIMCVGCDLLDSRLAIDFAKNHEHCFASIGLHPHEAQHYVRDQVQLDAFAELVSEPKVVAVGECGLDYFYEHSPRDDQIAILKFQLELATRHNLALIFHVREAYEDFWPIFDEFHSPTRPVRGVLHSFTDNAANLAEAVKRGLYIGVNGIATFAKDQTQLEVYRTIPLTNLLLETDAPFLTPAPYRGSINTPKHVVTVANFLSDLRAENISTLATATTTNARTLFGI